jgi:hypothetical protein
MRGGEKVLEALCDLYPDADIFTLVCDPGEVSQKIARHRIVTSFIDRLPGGRKHYKSLAAVDALRARELRLERIRSRDLQ